MYKEIFHERVRKSRIDAGYTQAQVADVLKIARSSISKYDTGHLEPNLERLAMLGSLFGVSVDYLLGIE